MTAFWRSQYSLVSKSTSPRSATVALDLLAICLLLSGRGAGVSIHVCVEIGLLVSNRSANACEERADGGNPIAILRPQQSLFGRDADMRFVPTKTVEQPRRSGDRTERSTGADQDSLRGVWSDASEKLAERHGLHLSVETVRRWMLVDGIWKDRRQRLKPGDFEVRRWT
ncbi:hypothetical protein [Bradyrhizobium sp. Arg816]|uniref:hypothetical protein n=1 Tax=Bradyrhizobium sp. Arg816 TaxID=2998491 RepID=UPI00249EBE1A|nr:hypothetical protein [Bradyrhizobium sp. Arg816]MDI3567502.1 hypothetical protein [Bradyrhizobium sp. Arg816]